MASAAQDMQNDYDPWDAACVDLTDISAAAPAPRARHVGEQAPFQGSRFVTFAPQTKEAPFFNSGLFPICLDQT